MAEPGEDTPFCSGDFIGGAAFHYTSDDPRLLQWDYQGELLHLPPDELLGSNWECVNIVNFPVHGKSFLAFGTEPAFKMAWVAGEYDAAEVGWWLNVFPSFQPSPTFSLHLPSKLQ